MDEKGPQIRVEDVENDHGKLHANYNENLMNLFEIIWAEFNLAEKKIQREVSRLSKWNKRFFQGIKNVFECFQATDIAITSIIYCNDKF